MDLLGVLEGILFVSGDEGVTLEEISEYMDLSLPDVKKLLLDLKSSYESSHRGMRIRYLGNAFKLTTKEEHKPIYQKMAKSGTGQNLSPSLLEVLAIVAYNEPITRVEIDAMRGISSSFAIRKLVAMGFLKEAGKSTMPGRPNLYKTTHEFLDYFGLATLKDLPVLEKVEKEKEEKDLFSSIYKEEQEV